MGTCYLIACVPLVLGAVLWLNSRRVTFAEWVKGAVIGFLVAGIFHVISIWAVTADVEMWSGRIICATHHPEWTGEGSDDTVETYPEQWSVTASYGSIEERYSITQEEFEEFRQQFGVTELASKLPPKPGFIDGDPHVYVAENHSEVLIPSYTVRLFENRVKASPSLFSYADVPDGAEVYPYPAQASSEDHLTALALDFVATYVDENARHDELLILPREWRESPRLIGKAKEHFETHAWDCLNAELGPAKRVNLIAIGFEGDRSMALWQEAEWLGGKKNDLVLCYGPLTAEGHASWAYCFGWSDSDVVKRNLESLLLSHPVGNELLTDIATEITQNYQIRHWPDFDYLAVAAPPGAYKILVLVTIFIQGGYWTIALLNRSRRRATGAREVAAEKRETERARRKRLQAEHRKQVKEHLGALDDPKDVDQLAEALLDEDDTRRSMVAASALGGSDDPRALCKLVLGLTHPRFRVRQISGEELAESPYNGTTLELCRPAVGDLWERREHDNAVVRRAANRLLTLIDPEWPASQFANRRIEQSVQQIEQSSELLSDGQLGSLRGLGRSAFDALVPLVEHKRAIVRKNALRALGRTGDSRALSVLGRTITAENSQDQADALAGLASLEAGTPLPLTTVSLVNKLASFAGDSDSGSSYDAIRALGKLRCRAVLGVLLPLLGSNSWQTRAGAIAALGDLGEPSAITPLAALALRGQSNEQLRVIDAFIAIGDAAAIEPLLQIYSHVQGAALLVQENVIRALGTFRSPKAVSALEECLEGLDPFMDEELFVSCRERIRELKSGEGLSVWLRGPHHSL